MRNFSTKLSKMAVSLLLALSTVITTKPVITVSAATGDTPPHTKNLINNHDGTYTLSLDVVGESEKKPNNVNVIVIFDRSGSMANPNNTNQRLNAAKNAVNSLANSLFAYNTQSAPNTVQMALVTFSNIAENAQAPTTSLNSFRTAVNAVNAAGGTNWEGALQAANNVNFGDDDQTFVVFVSDGNPTFRFTEGNYPNHTNDYNASYNRDYGVWGSGSDNGTGAATTIARCYEHAVDDAEVLVNKVGASNFFAIGAFGNVDRMESLVDDAGSDSSKNYYSAQDSAGLNQAISDILAKIEMMGIGNTEIDDGTTNRVVTSSGEIAKLLEVDTSSFKYYRSNGSYGTMQPWNDAPEAELVDGEVQWDLSSEGVLENGVKYTVTFDVYPSQYTYDTIAQLKNGDITYASLDSEVKKYIVDNGNGNYTLRTNTSALLTWDDTRDDEGQQTSSYVNPDPVATDAETLPILKEWEGGEPNVDSVDVTVMMGDEVFHTATLTKDNGWNTSSFISIGIIKNGQALPGALGHDFSFAELDGSQYHWEIDAPTVRPMLVNGTRTMLVKVDDKHPAPSGATTYTIEGATYYADTEMAGLTATNHRRSNLNLLKTVTGEDAPEDATFPFTLTVNNAAAPDTEPEDDPDHESDYWLWFSIWDTKAGAAVTDATVSGTGLVGPNADGYYYIPSGTPISVQMKDGWNLRFLNLHSETTYTFVEGDLADGFAFKEAKLTQGEDSTFRGGKTTTGTIENTKTSYQVEYTNDYQLTNLEITKVWVDNNDQDGKRLTANELKAKLTLSPAVEGKEPTVVDNGDNTYTITYTGLPRFNNGEEVEYTVTESDLSDIGYTTTGSPAKDHGTITNTHTPDETTVTVTKVWDDADDQDGIRPESISVQLKADGAASGEAVELNEANQWTYTWEDLAVNNDGTAISYTVDETAVPEGYNKTVGEVTGDAESGFEVEITNTHTPDETTVTVTKVWDGEPEDESLRIRPEEISMQLYANGEESGDPVTLDEGNSWTYTWEDLAVNEDGEEIEYTVDETEVPEGYEKTIGEVTGDAENGFEVVITNTYTPTPITVSFPAIKELVVPDGMTGPEKWEYTFNVAADGDAPVADTMSGKVYKNETGTVDTVTFGEFEFTMPGTYTYTVTETGTVPGVTNDSEASTGKAVMITVEDNGEGELTATVNPEAGITFTNTYGTSETTATFPVKKFMKVPSNLKGPKEWSYTFTVTPVGEAPVADTMSGTVFKNETETVDTITFGTFTYTTPGKYYYTVSEDGTVPGVKNDPDASGKTVTVNVVDNGDGSMTATADSTEGKPLEFVNVYDVEPTTAQLKVYKKVYASGSTADKIIKLNSAKSEEEKPEETADETPAEETPEVTEASEATTEPAPAETEAPEVVPAETTPEVTTEEVTEETGSTSEEEPAPAVTEVPVVEEEANAAEDLVSLLRGMSLFTTVYAEEAEETVEPAATAEPETVEEVPAETAAPAVVEEPVETVEEPEPTATPAETLVPVFTEEPVATEAPEATATAEATAAPEATAVPAGTPEATTTAVPEATATPEATGTPEATATAKSEELEEDEDPVEDSFDAMLKGLKYVILGTAKNGSTLVGLPVKEGDFEFTLDGEGVHEVVTNGAAGAGEAAEAVFSEIEYTEPGTYTYTITETNAPTWYQKNTQTITATVTVEDDQEGHLVATVEYSPEDPTFENYYVTNDVTVEFEGVKELKGRDLEAGEFTFELYDSEDNLLETAQNDATGKVKFSTITYTKADDLGPETEKTFTYTVKETSGSLGGVTYDANEATITVTVKDDGKGKLTAEVSPAEAPLFTFTNTYKAEGEITLSGTKVLEGGELTEGQFSFELVDSEGNVVETVSNAADGTFAFTTLKYVKKDGQDDTGTYTYKIREKIPENKKGIAYTDKVYDVTITVTDNKDGTLSVTSKPDAGSFSFTNKVLKVLVNKYNDSNKKLKGATITLYDENGAEIVSWTSDGKEPFDFGPYVEAGKKYLIKETKVPKGYTRFKDVVFTVDPDGTVNISLKVDNEGAYKLVDKTIPKEDTPPDKPVVPLPPTDVNGGNSNTGMMGGMLAASMAGVIAALYQLLKNRKQYN